MKDHLKVALIIVNYNGGQTVIECLESVSRQIFRPHRIIVVDNASTDTSLSIIKKRFPEVETISNDVNLGFSVANNLAVREAHDCQWVALLNPDAFPDPKWLENLMEVAGEKPEYSFFGSTQIKYEDQERMDGTGDVYHVSGMSWRRDFGCLRSESKRGYDEIFSPCAAAALYKRDAFLEVGGFDENFFSQIDDVDLGFRLRLSGYKCLHVPNAIVYHIGSASFGKNSQLTDYYAHRNMVWTFFKNMPSLMFWRYLPQHILINIFILLRLSLKGRSSVIFKAKWDALKDLKRILKQRKVIQNSSHINSKEVLAAMPKGWLLPFSREKKFSIWR